MAYATSNPPRLVTTTIGATPFQLWVYRSTDAAATVDTANYFTNGGDLGIRVGDLIYVSNTTGNITTIHQVSATGNGTTDVNDLTTITQTDTD
jgi:hypothetical protein